MTTASNAITAETRALIEYLTQATRDWSTDYEVTVPDDLSAAIMFTIASLHGYAEEPSRDLLANALASAAGLAGILADRYQFPGEDT